MSAITVLSDPERRRRWTVVEKLRIVEASVGGGASVAEVARRHDVHPNLLHL
jgi:transposase